MGVIGIQKLGRNAFSSAFFGALGVASTVVVDAVVLAVFGLGWRTDAYLVALTVPMLLVTIMSLQASRVVQPLFIHAREKEGEAAGWHVLNLMVSTSTTLVVAVSVAGVLAAGVLVRLQSPGLDASSTGLASRLSWILFLLLPVFCPCVILQAALNGLGSFALPGASKLIGSIARLVFLLVFHKHWGVFALVWGTAAGVCLEVCLFYWALRRHGYRFQVSVAPRAPLFRRGLRMMQYPVTAQLTSVGVELANNALGSMLGPGNISALRFATRIIDALAGLFANSIVVAAAPALTSELSVNNTGKARVSMRHALHLLLLVTVPLSFWLIVMGQPLISFLYERKNFTATDVHVVGSVLMLMIPYIFLSRLLGLAELVFFGKCDTKTPFIGSFLIAVLYILTSLALYDRLHLYALPVGRSVSYAIGALVMLYLAARSLEGLGFRSMLHTTGRIVVASALMALTVMLTLRQINGETLAGFAGQALRLGVPSTIGGLVLLGALWGLRVMDVPSLKTLPGLRWLARHV